MCVCHNYILPKLCFARIVFCHNYMASSASGPPCFCPLSQGRFIAAFFPSVGALHTAVSFVVPTPPLHLTLSYNAQSGCPIFLLPHSLYSPNKQLALQNISSHILSCPNIAPSSSSPWEDYTQRCHLLSRHPPLPPPHLTLSYAFDQAYPTYHSGPCSALF